MKPAELSDRKYTCPMVDILLYPYDYCKEEFTFKELVKHLRDRHDTQLMLAWITAAIWEDVCSGHDPDCA